MHQNFYILLVRFQSIGKEFLLKEPTLRGLDEVWTGSCSYGRLNDWKLNTFLGRGLVVNSICMGRVGRTCGDIQVFNIQLLI